MQIAKLQKLYRHHKKNVKKIVFLHFNQPNNAPTKNTYNQQDT